LDTSFFLREHLEGSIDHDRPWGVECVSGEEE
jgi:hypothetical protein